MTQEEKIHTLREMIEESAILIADCERFISGIYSGTLERSEMLGKIKKYKIQLNATFRPEVIQ